MAIRSSNSKSRGPSHVPRLKVSESGRSDHGGLARVLRLGLLCAVLAGAADAQVLIPHFTDPVRDVAVRGNSVWVVSEAGRVFDLSSVGGHGEILAQKADLKRQLYCLEPVNGGELIGASDGVHRVEGRRYVPVSLPEIVPDTGQPRVYFLVYDPPTGMLFIGTEKGVYRQSNGGRPQPTEVSGRLGYLKKIDGVVWASTAQDTYRADSNGVFKPLIPGHPVGNVVDIETVGATVFLKTTYSGPWGKGSSLWRYVPGMTKPTRLERTVLAIGKIANDPSTEADDELWFSVGKKIHAIAGQSSTVSNRDPLKQDVLFIAEKGDSRWIGSSGRLYRRVLSNGERVLLAGKEDALKIHRVEVTSGGDLWFFGGSGAFRLYDDVKIDIEANKKRSGWKGILRDVVFFGNVIKIKEAYYLKDGKRWNPPGKASSEAKFRGIISTNWQQFDALRESLSYADIRTLGAEPSSTSVFFSIQDAYGNIHEPDAYKDVIAWSWCGLLCASLGWIVGSLIFLAIFCAVLFAVFVLGLGPFSKLQYMIYFWLLDKIPFLRSLFSLYWSYVRCALSRIYMKALRRDWPRAVPIDSGRSLSHDLRSNTSHFATLVTDDAYPGLTLDNFCAGLVDDGLSGWRPIFPLRLTLRQPPKDQKLYSGADLRAILGSEVQKQFPFAPKHFEEEAMKRLDFLLLLEVPWGQEERIVERLEPLLTEGSRAAIWSVLPTDDSGTV